MALVDVLGVMTLEFVLEVVTLKKVPDVIVLEEVLVELMSSRLLPVPVNFDKVEVVALERAEELALKTEADETLPDPLDSILDGPIFEDNAVTIPIRLYRARVSSNMTNDLYMSKAEFNKSQRGCDDYHSSNKKVPASAKEIKPERNFCALSVYVALRQNMK